MSVRIQGSEKKLLRTGWDVIIEGGYPRFKVPGLPFLVSVNCDGDFEVEHCETRDYVCSVLSGCSTEFLIDRAVNSLEEGISYA